MMGWGDAGFGLMGIFWFLAMAAFWVLIAAGVILVVRALVNSGKPQAAQGVQPPPPVSVQPVSHVPVAPVPSAAATAPSVEAQVTGPVQSEALRILEERYARGEIEREEFLQRKVDLLS